MNILHNAQGVTALPNKGGRKNCRPIDLTCHINGHLVTVCRIKSPMPGRVAATEAPNQRSTTAKEALVKGIDNYYGFGGNSYEAHNCTV